MGPPFPAGNPRRTSGTPERSRAGARRSGEIIAGRPTARRSLWRASIPAQAPAAAGMLEDRGQQLTAEPAADGSEEQGAEHGVDARSGLLQVAVQEEAGDHGRGGQ